jgi:hypothetical protein
MSGRVRAWVVTASTALTLSAVAVAVVRSTGSNPIIQRLWRLAEFFASPGELLWWATLGGAFAGYPSGVSGHLMWVVGSALFWFLAATPFIAMAPRVRDWFRSRR